MQVCVVYSPAARQVLELPVQLPAGASVREALQASGLAARCPELELDGVSVGVWGRRATLEQILREQDRVEIYRPLRVDPKVARRERFKRQGAGRTGLFANRRAGAKSGY